MNIRKIREDLGKVRTSIQRRDIKRAIYLFCLALKEVGAQQAPTDVRGDIRTALADICSDPFYKENNGPQISYQPGKEKDLLVLFSKFYNGLGESLEEEDYETALKRKLNLDRCIRDGKSFISQGKYSDADNSFAEALQFYKNEIAAFGMMAKAMMDAGQYVRATAYLKKGLAQQPNNVELRRLVDECVRLRNAGSR